MTGRRGGALALAAAALMLVLPACGGDSAEPGAVGAGIGEPAPGGDGSALPDPTTTAAGGVPGGGTATGSAGGSATDGGTPPGSGSPNDSSTVPPAAVPPDRGPGSYAPFYLQATSGSQLVLEVHVQSGASVGSRALEHARSNLADASGKSVSAPGPYELVDGRTSWTVADIRRVADEQARAAQGGGVGVLRVLVLRGSAAENESALGVAVSGSVLAVFVDKIDQAASPLVGAARIEQAVLLHEVGHLLGLVDLCLDRDRDDPEHPHHSSNRSSVMYWAIESDLIGQVLDGPPPIEFDDADRNDLAAIRAGGC